MINETQNTTTSVQGTEGVETLFHKVRMEVIESYPSIFSKDDVILLVDRLQKDIGGVISSNPSEDLDTFIKLPLSVVNEIIESVVNETDFEDFISLDLYDREISVDFDKRSLIKELISEIEDKGHSYME